MRRTSNRARSVSLALVLSTTAALPAFALDPVCKQLLAIYMTETQTIPNAAMAKVAGQIGMGGTKQTEEISTGTDVYVLSDGKWIDMQTSFASMEADLDASKCTALPDETVDGQSARVFQQSSPTLGIETKIWISKTSGRVVHTRMTNDAGALKLLTVSRYDYGAVQAPANAVTMQVMARSRAAH